MLIFQTMMGPEAMGVTVIKLDWWDDRVCRNYLFGTCPHLIFGNTVRLSTFFSSQISGKPLTRRKWTWDHAPRLTRRRFSRNSKITKRRTRMIRESTLSDKGTKLPCSVSSMTAIGGSEPVNVNSRKHPRRTERLSIWYASLPCAFFHLADG